MSLTAVALLIQGCGGMTGFAALSRSERATVEAVRLDIRLGVEGERYVLRIENGQPVYGRENEWYRDQFIAAMRERKLFREVGRVDEFASPPDLVATVGRRVATENPLPFYTYLTLGFFPTIANVMERLEVTFGEPHSKPVQVAVEHSGKVVLGWAGGLFATIVPGWMFPGTYSRRMYDQLALAITMKADAILALARSTAK